MARALRLLSSGPGGRGLVFSSEDAGLPPPGSPWHPRGAVRPGGAGCLFLALPGPRLGFVLRAGGRGAAGGGRWLVRPAIPLPTAKDRQEIFCSCSIACPLRSSEKRPGLFLQLLRIEVQFLFLLLIWPFPIYGHVQAVPPIVDQATGRAVAIVLGTPWFHFHAASSGKRFDSSWMMKGAQAEHSSSTP